MKNRHCIRFRVELKGEIFHTKFYSIKEILEEGLDNDKIWEDLEKTYCECETIFYDAKIVDYEIIDMEKEWIKL